MDRITETVWELMAALKLVEKTEVRCCGVTPYQGYILAVLLECGPASMQFLAERMCVADSTMTRNIDKLEKSGMVRRIKSPRDARVINVLLTEKGKITGREVDCSWQDYYRNLVRCLGPEKEKTMMKGLEVLLEGIKMAGTCCENQCKEEKTDGSEQDQ
jgi:DNA-binding MarR family transcriptional regulator